MHEQNLNVWIGESLRLSCPDLEVVSEKNAIAGSKGQRVDIVIKAAGVNIFIENKYAPNTADAQCRQRLGQKFLDHGEIHATISLQSPLQFVDLDNTSLTELREVQEFGVALYHREQGEIVRYPEHEGDFVKGDLLMLSALVRLVSARSEQVKTVLQEIEHGVSTFATAIQQQPEISTIVVNKVRSILYQHGSARPGETEEATLKMCGLILMNAMVFQNMLTTLNGVDSLTRMLLENETVDVVQLSSTWTKILQVNYHPIYQIALSILAEASQVGMFGQVLRHVLHSAKRISDQWAALARGHDIFGTLFQTLVAERKFLATYYTKPASAAFVARLALHMLGEKHIAKDVTKLRVVDPSCGTGTLLAAVYRRLQVLHENESGGSFADQHRAMLEHVFYGFDVLPQATHLTLAALASNYPQELFRDTNVHTMKFGRGEDEAVYTGSLELLESESNLLAKTVSVRWRGDRSEKQTNVKIPAKGFDLVIANPPYTSADSIEKTGLDDLGEGVSRFKAFGTDAETSKLVDKRLKKLRGKNGGNSNAGLGSDFLAMGAKLVRDGGVIAFILPLTFANSAAWRRVRQHLIQDFSDITLASAHSEAAFALSADTNMREVAVLAKKTPGKGNRKITYLNINGFPDLETHAAGLAEAVIRLPKRQGAVPIGNSQHPLGTAYRTQVQGDAFQLVAIRGLQAVALIDEHLRALGTKPLGDFAGSAVRARTIRLYRNDNPAGNTAVFQIYLKSPDTTYRYPFLWKNNNKVHVQMRSDCQHYGERRDDYHAGNLKNILAAASRVSFNIDTDPGAQPLQAISTNEASHGGRSLVTVPLRDARWEPVVTMWYNTSLGFGSVWLHGSSQQKRRVITSKSGVVKLPMLDLDAMTDAQLDKAAEVFAEHCDNRLLPLCDMAVDDNRIAMETAFFREVLGVDDDFMNALNILRRMLSEEPAIHGGKKSRATLMGD